MTTPKGKAARTATPGTASKTLKTQLNFTALNRIKQAIQIISLSLLLNPPMLAILVMEVAR